MKELNFNEKVDLINSHFESLIGNKIEQFQTVQLFCEENENDDDGGWGDWNDQPISLFFSEDRVVSVSWSKFDEIWMASERKLRGGNSGMQFRWVKNNNSLLLPIIGQQLSSVWLGQEDVSLSGRKLEIWSRLFLNLNNVWLEIYNAMDENGYELHASKPQCEMFRCS